MTELFIFTEAEQRALKERLSQAEARLSPYAAKGSLAIRRYDSKYHADGDLIRNNYAVDVDKIIHSPFFNRGADKTQVFSFYKNDDITRRSSHVHLVSRIARIIGQALTLNTDLIEAIAIGHDIGHTPFGHKGEEFLSKLYYRQKGRYFNHNVHSVRILSTLTLCNLTFHTLDGILCHCGEKAFAEYRPHTFSSFAELDKMMEACYTQKDAVKKLRPSTLEGCVVRISDMIAYLGKDRQDAARVKLDTGSYEINLLGGTNRDIITNAITNIIKNSLGKPYIRMDGEVYEALESLRTENNEKIYDCRELREPYYQCIEPMMERMFGRLLGDWQAGGSEPAYLRHHRTSAKEKDPVERTVDFIASMTDDYFIDLYIHLFGRDELVQGIRYVEYFDDRYM